MADSLRVGIDARPALFGRTGFGRVVAETIAALRCRPDVELRPFGAAWRRPRPDHPLGAVRAPRVPARVQSLLSLLGFGVEHLLGPIDLYHHTDLVHAPVARVPEVLTIYDLVFLEDARWHAPGFARRVEPRLRRRAAAAAAIVVPCERVADAVMRHGVAPAERITVAPLGADHIASEPGSDDAQVLAALLEGAGLSGGDGPLVLVPGTREPRKNQTALLDAFQQVVASVPARLLFVGPRGWRCEELERRLAQLVATDRRVGVAGEVPDRELGVLLRSADVVAYPSLAEGFGLPVFEAMRCGRAVLTSKGTPMADLARDAVELVDPTDGMALAAGLSRLLTSPERRAELGAAATERVASLTWAAHTDVLLSVYRSTLS